MFCFKCEDEQVNNREFWKQVNLAITREGKEMEEANEQELSHV
jgi:hypothetical protein